MNKKAYSAPIVRVELVEIVVPLALSGAEQSNMGTHTNKEIDADNALAPRRRWHSDW